MKLDEYLFSLSANFLKKIVIIICGFVLVGLILLLTIRIDVVVEANGEIIPKNYSVHYAKSNGEVVFTNFDNGKLVQSGELLMILDTNDVYQEIQILKNEILIKKKKLIEKRNIIKKDKLLLQNNAYDVNVELENMEIDYKLSLINFLPSLKANEINNINIDKFNPTEIKDNIVLRQKKNNMEKVKLKLENINLEQKELDERKKNLIVDEMEIENIFTKIEQKKSEIKKKYIYATCDGVITCENINDYKNKFFRTGDKILEVHNPEWEIKALIPEESLSKIEKNQLVDIQIKAYNHLEYQSFEGILIEISNRKNGNTLEGIPNNFYEAIVKITDEQIKHFDIRNRLNANLKIITYNDLILNVLMNKLQETGSTIF